MRTEETSALDDMASAFVRRVENREAVVGIIGLGYVGLPLLLAFHKSGFRTAGFDIDPEKIEKLEAGRSYIHHIAPERIAELVGSGRCRLTTDYSRLSEVDAILICVPTPLTTYRDPDMSFVTATAEAIAPHLRPGQLVTLESTTYPMTSEDLLATILERSSGLKAGRDFAIAYSPEREDPGNPVRVPSMRTAEAVKLTENVFRAVNIALVNELKVIFDQMGIDVFEVIDAAKTKPFGFMPFYPGPGIGGHCIPVDPFYLTWKAREFGIHTRFIELAGEINSGMPQFVVGRLVEALSNRLAKPIRGARVLVVGLAYKKNVDDVRESPSLVLMEMLQDRGAIVDYYDPYVPVMRRTRKHGELEGRCSIAWDEEALAGYDAALIATDHDGVDLETLVRKVPLVVDSRGATRSLPPDLQARVGRA